MQAYQTRPVAGMQLEAHRRFIDIQHLVPGREAIHWAPLASLGEAAMPCDASKDAALYAMTGGTVPVPLSAGQFAILFSDDAHAPCCTWGDPEEVLKVVVKVEMSDFRS